MKKLLSILATVGLASTASATVVACGQTNEPKATTRDAKLPAPVNYWLTEEYEDGDTLNPTDVGNLTREVKSALKEANKDANFSDDTFTVTSKDIKTDTKSLDVEVKKTEPKEDKVGLNETKLKVEIIIYKITKQIDAVGPKEILKLAVPNSKPEEVLHPDDQIELRKVIIDALKEANKGAVIEDDTFSVNLNTITPESSIVWASNKETKSNGAMPGLKASVATIEVGLDLSGQLPKQDANTAIVEMNLVTTRGEHEFVTSDDKELLKEEIKSTLERVNPNAVIEEDTFEINLPENLMNDSRGLLIKVNSTESTLEKHGLNDGQILIALVLHSKWTQVPARGVDVQFDLEKTHLGEKLAGSDKEMLQAKILDQLKRVNDDAVILDDTFGFATLDELIVAKEEMSIDVTVQETEATYEKHGLTSDSVKVKLTLTPIKKEKVEVNLPTKPVQVNLNETHENENLTPEDKVLVAQAVDEALRKANEDAVIEDDTFKVDIEADINAADSTIKVLVHDTDSTIEKPGLEAKEITVELSLKEMQIKVPPRPAKAELKLEDTLIGNKLSDKDKTRLTAKILEELKENNTGVNIQDDTFEFNLDEFVVEGEEGSVSVHVNATDPTNDLKGFDEGDVEVKLNFILFIDELKNLVQETNLGFINDKDSKTILAAVEAKNPSAPNIAADVEVDKSSITETEATLVATNPNKYQGTVVVQFGVIQDVANLLDGKTDLGYFDTPEDAKAKAEEVIKGIEGLNGKVTIGDPTEEGTILVTANDESLKGTGTFNFGLKKDINDLLPREFFLEFYVSGEVANNAVQKQVNEIPELNGKVKVELNEEAKEITVSPNHDSLKGEPVKFSYKTSTKLDELIPETLRNLNGVKDSDEALNKANELIAGLELTGKAEANLEGENQIKVTFVDGSGLEGEVFLTFTIQP